MKKYILIIAVVFGLTSCVQKTHKRIVTVFVDVSKVKNIQTVGIRGADKPMSWNEDLVMEVVKKDSLYKKTFVINAGRMCTELKFTVNGNFEPSLQDNRKVFYNQSGTTVLKAVFDEMK